MKNTAGDQHLFDRDVSKICRFIHFCYWAKHRKAPSNFWKVRSILVNKCPTSSGVLVLYLLYFFTQWCENDNFILHKIQFGKIPHVLQQYFSGCCDRITDYNASFICTIRWEHYKTARDRGFIARRQFTQENSQWCYSRIANVHRVQRRDQVNVDNYIYFRTADSG